MNGTVPSADEAVAWREALRQVHAESVLLPMLVQLLLIILAARLFAMLLRKLGQPAVVGEIAAGLVLGPSVLGQLCPQLFQSIFHPQVGGIDPLLFDVVLRRILTALAHLGLVFLLFFIGLEFDFSHLRLRA